VEILLLVQRRLPTSLPKISRRLEAEVPLDSSVQWKFCFEYNVCYLQAQQTISRRMEEEVPLDSSRDTKQREHHLYLLREILFGLVRICLLETRFPVQSQLTAEQRKYLA
jgi:hypothetical protein